MIQEPYFQTDVSLAVAAGCVVEHDGGIWLVKPTNGFGGYIWTFPKGRPDKGETLQQCAIRECIEESGVFPLLTGFIADVTKTTTKTRYYRAEQIGIRMEAIDPDDEVEDVRLVPYNQVLNYLNHPIDINFAKRYLLK